MPTIAILSSSATSLSEWRNCARRAEDDGFCSLLIPDHIDQAIAPIPAVVAAADATNSLRIGTLVLANERRHPVQTAREVVTADILTEGRFEFGLGVGWAASDFEDLGTILPPPRVRLERLAESVTVLKHLLTGSSLTHKGKYYKFTCPAGTKPIQQPYPPLTIGGGGQSILTLAASTANTVNVSPTRFPNGIFRNSSDLRLVAVEKKLKHVNTAAAHRTSVRITLTLEAVYITPRPQVIISNLSRHYSLDPADIDSSPYFLVGSPAQITEKLLGLESQLGVEEFVAPARSMRFLSSVVSRLAK